MDASMDAGMGETTMKRSAASAALRLAALLCAAAAMGGAATIVAGLPLKFQAVLLGGFSLLFLIVVTGQPKAILSALLVLGMTLNLRFYFAVSAHIGIADGVTLSLVDLCLLALFFIKLTAERHVRPVSTPSGFRTALAFLLLLIAGFFSLANSPDLTLGLWGLLSYAKIFILYLYLAGSLRDRSDLAVLLAAVQLCLLLQGSVCMLQAATQTNFTLDRGILEEDPYAMGGFRAGGLIGSSTLAGGYIASLLPIVLIQFFLASGWSRKAPPLLASLAGAVGLVLTLSRGAWVSFGVGLAVMGVMLWLQGLLRWKHVIPPLVVAAALALACQARIAQRLDEGSANVTAREVLIQTALNMAADHPLLGAGLNGYTLLMGRYEPNQDYLTPRFSYLVHNKYMLVLAEMGVPGLLAFLAVILFAGASLRRAWRDGDRVVSLSAIGFAGSLAAMTVNMLSESYDAGAPVHHFWFTIAMATALAGLSVRDARRRSRFFRPGRAEQDSRTGRTGNEERAS